MLIYSKDEKFRYYILRQKSDVFHAMKTFFRKEESIQLVCPSSLAKGVFLLTAGGPMASRQTIIVVATWRPWLGQRRAHLRHQGHEP
ncbi:hypothetical protein EP10_002149 [Geobacillus icigianus]|uniref:Uncharacterized protein n=1 Tax=Geobacillus icigianus TaxID=1430331 RepID=A0ABU6BIT5_9BACL|nr:hypothetical protein [Geobacillus icigianus]